MFHCNRQYDSVESIRNFCFLFSVHDKSRSRVSTSTLSREIKFRFARNKRKYMYFAIIVLKVIIYIMYSKNKNKIIGVLLQQLTTTVLFVSSTCIHFIFSHRICPWPEYYSPAHAPSNTFIHTLLLCVIFLGRATI